MSNCKIHNVRFYKPKPEAIYCMALQKSQKKLAVARADTSIEIWNLSHCPFIERTIPSIHRNFSIESIAWCNDRLFSVGLHGLLVEYDLQALSTKQELAITGEAAFCLDISKDDKNIAIGTEQGYLNIFSIHEDEVLFNKFLDKQEGRILCLKYDPSGKFIVSGSVDAIRVWDVNSGHAIHKMTTGRSEANKVTVIWCLYVLEDLTIISGDSRGKLTFWDGKVGSQIESYQSHKADVLALCVSDDEKSLYCAGTDPNIMNYVKVNVKGDNHKWVKSIQRKVHDHDVRSLVLHDGKLYSSGIDGYLACSYHPPKTLIKYPPVIKNPCVTICSESRFILLRYSKHLEVWRLGKSTTAEKNYSGLLPLDTEPKHLLTLQRIIKEDDGSDVKEGIICCSMSNDGKWIVFSTDSVLRFFHFNYEENKAPELAPVDNLPEECSEENKAPELTPVDNLPEECSVSVQAIFTPDSSKLILASRKGTLQIYYLREGTPILGQSIDTQSLFSDTITFLTTSSCGKYLAAADPQSRIIVWKFCNREFKHHCQLPQYHSSPTAVAIKGNSESLAVVAAYADHRVVEYDLNSKSFTSFSKMLSKQHPKSWPNKTFAIRNITFDPRFKNVNILHDDSNIVVIDEKKALLKSQAKIPKIESTTLSDSNDSFKSSKHAIHAIKKYKHLVHLGWLSDDEMVAVEVSPLSILEQLPPCLKQNTFGTK